MKKIAVIGILYLLWEFVAGVELLQAQYRVDERITATRQCTSNTPSCGGHRGGRRGGGGLEAALGGFLGSLAGSIVGPMISGQQQHPQQQVPVIVRQPVSYPQRSSIGYPNQHVRQVQEGIYITGGGDAIESVKRALLSRGKIIVLQRQYASTEMRVIQRKVGAEIHVTVEIIDILNGVLIDNQVGRAELTGASQEAHVSATLTAVHEVMNKITSI